MTRNLLALGVVWSLGACNGTDSGTDTETPPVDATDSGLACTNPISQANTFPEPGATDVYYRTSIRIELLQAEPSATVVMTAEGGTPVAGTPSIDDNVISYVPEAPLMPSTTYTLTVSYSCGDVPISWTTSDVGDALAVDVVGKVYELDLAGGQWVEPPGIGAALASVAGDIEVLVSPSEATETISFLGALGTGDDAQDDCEETFILTGASFEDPYFELESKLLPFRVSGIDVDIEDLFLSGAFSPDGTALSGAVLSGTIDTRPLVPLIGETEENAVCDLAVQIANVDCEACSDGSGDFCMSVRVEDIAAPEIATNPLIERTQKEIDADPTCTVQQP